MTEKAFQDAVVALCHYLHVSCYHVWDSRKSDPGFPDCVIVGPRAVIFRELKTELGRLSPAQRRWGEALVEAGANWAVWRPRDLPTITAEIEHLCGRGRAA